MELSLQSLNGNTFGGGGGEWLPRVGDTWTRKNPSFPEHSKLLNTPSAVD